MLKKFFAILLLCGACLPMAAGQSSELDQLIDRLQAKYNKLASLSADFTQIHTGSQTRRESGRVLLKKPGKMRWDYTAPEAKLFISDGKTLYEYVPAEKYASKSSIRDSGDMRAPFAFLLGRGNLRRDFKKIEFAKETPARAGNKVLRMVPKRAADFRELLVEVEPTSLQIARLTLIESGGARSDFLFSNVQENPPVNAAQFVFKAPPGIEVRSN